MSLLQMSLAGGCIILVTLIVRALALYRMPKRALNAMWGLAALRMLIPFRLPAKTSIFSIFRRISESTAAAGEFLRNGTAGGGTAARLDGAQSKVMTAAEASPWTFIWLAGVMLCAAGFILLYCHGARKFRDAEPVEDERIDAWLKNHALRRKIAVRCTESAAAPLTRGLLHPVILLPRTWRDDEERLDLILSHEWMHIRRWDALRKPVFIAVACLHWFNPLAWVMLMLANRDIELACDEQVLHMHGDRRAYAMTLISMESEKGPSVPLGNHFAKNAIEERITAIMKMKQKSLLSAILAALMLLGTAAAFATSAATYTYVQTTNEVSEKEFLAKYVPFGLSYDEEEDRLYYQGKKVRYFEDMYPAGEAGTMTGTVMQYPDGEVDVYAVRDLSGDIIRNADGSYDPSGVLMGVEVCSQEEFDARTTELESQSGEYACYSGADVSYEIEEGPVISITGPQGYTIVEEIKGEDNASVEYTYSVIGGSDGPTSIFVAGEGSNLADIHVTKSSEEQADDGRLFADTFDQYTPFGLTVENDALYFEGQRVRSFKDSYKADFFRTVSCEHYDEEGEIDVVAIRKSAELTALQTLQ